MNNKLQHEQSMEETARPSTIELSPGHAIGHILVCLNSSTGSAICIEYALSLANTFDSAVTFMNVMRHHDDSFGPHTTDALGWELSRQEARARLEQLEKEAVRKYGRQIGVRLEQGDPAERIVALSHELGADLVVLGCHEHNGYPSWELGRTAQQVLAAGRSSVLIARGCTATASFVPPKRILVPLDGSPRTESVLPTAESIAKSHGAQLALLHVVPEPLPTCVLVEPEDLQLAQHLATRLETQARRYLEAIRHKLGCDQSLVDIFVERQADRRQFLVEMSEREQIDLIVLSAHGSTCDVTRPFGSMTAHLLTHSKVTLLVIQDLPASELASHGQCDEHQAAPLRGTFPRESH